MCINDEQSIKVLGRTVLILSLVKVNRACCYYTEYVAYALLSVVVY